MAAVAHDEEPPPDLIAGHLDQEQSGTDRTDIDDSDDEPFDSLVAGRSRRQTAGNRLSALLGQEEPDEDLDLLFAENGEEDVEFDVEDAEEPSDADDDSSSSSEDGNAQDDLEGETQLRKEERTQRISQKRKAEKAFIKPPKVRKRVKIEAPEKRDAGAATIARPRKKGPPRTHMQQEALRKSARALTIQNKERTQASIQENEARRKKAAATNEATQRKKEAERAKPLTQAERMSEAAETERLNSKSLNAYEETEKERLRKQRARLEALHNRVLEGPVIRWCSAKAEWVNGQLNHFGKRLLVEEVKPTGRGLQSDPTPIHAGQGQKDLEQKTQDHASPGSPKIQLAIGDSQQPPRSDHEAHDSSNKAEAPQGTSGLLDGIDYYATLSDSAAQANPSNQANPDNPTRDAQKSDPDPAAPVKLGTEASMPFKDTDHLQQSEGQQKPTLEPGITPKAPQIEHSARNTLTLLNFHPMMDNSLELKRRILFGWRDGASGNAVSPAKANCAITGRAGRYLDPQTGLAYSSLEAYKAIRRLVKACATETGPSERSADVKGNGREKECADGAKPVWSSLLGAWIGTENDAASGVPSPFVRQSSVETSGERTCGAEREG